MNNQGFYIQMKSATQAEKARQFLARNGVRSDVRRFTARGGCAFKLYIFSDRKGEVCRLLSKIGISCGIS